MESGVSYSGLGQLLGFVRNPCNFLLYLVVAGGLTTMLVRADGTRAECGFAATPEARRDQTASCEKAALFKQGGCQMGFGDIAFTVVASGAGSIGQLTVQATGPQMDTQSFSQELDGNAYRAEVADLDANGWPEVYISVSSAGSGSYGSLVAYAVNKGKSMTSIYLRPLADDSQARIGYLGHDEFAVVENRLVRRFPIYLQGDTNSAPTGGTRQLCYALMPGEAGWVLAQVLDEQPINDRQAN